MVDEMPFFSIITVTLNHLSGLKKTFDSVRTQTCQDYEWIVVDGASKDGTVQFLQTLAFPPLYWVSEPDNGLYDAMNKGMAMAKGQYFLFMNAGDELADAHVLDIAYRCAVGSSYPDLIYGDAYEWVNGHLYLKKARSPWAIWYGMFAHHQAIFYKKEALGEIRYRTEYTLAADFALTSELFSHTRVAAHKVHIPVCIFEGGGATSTFRAHFRGMVEQWHICSSIQKRHKVICSLIFLLHVSKHVVFHFLRPVYILLRYRQTDKV